MGTSWPKVEHSSVFFFDLEYLRHSWQFNISCSSCSFRPGQYTAWLARSLHFVSPRWLSWICLRIASHLVVGMTMQVPFKTRPSSMVRSSRKVQYGWRICGISLILAGQLVIIVCLRRASSLSVWVACLMACKLSLLAGSWWDMWYTWSFGSLMASCWLPNCDKQSVSRFLVPGMYLTVKLYGRVLIRRHCILGVTWLRLLDSIASRGFWSVSNMKWHLYRKWWNFSTAHVTVSDSISIATYPLCISVRALLAK